jgi:hypothetical protein
VVTLSGVALDAKSGAAGVTDTATTSASIGSAALLWGLITASNIVTTLSIGGNDTTGAPVVTNTATTTIGNVTVAGISIAHDTIAPNTRVAVTG